MIFSASLKYRKQLYDTYKEIYQEYDISKVLPPETMDDIKRFENVGFLPERTLKTFLMVQNKDKEIKRHKKILNKKLDKLDLRKKEIEHFIHYSYPIIEAIRNINLINKYKNYYSKDIGILDKIKNIASPLEENIQAKRLFRNIYGGTKTKKEADRLIQQLERKIPYTGARKSSHTNRSERAIAYGLKIKELNGLLNKYRIDKTLNDEDKLEKLSHVMKIIDIKKEQLINKFIAKESQINNFATNNTPSKELIRRFNIERNFLRLVQKTGREGSSPSVIEKARDKIIDDMKNKDKITYDNGGVVNINKTRKKNKDRKKSVLPERKANKIF